MSDIGGPGHARLAELDRRISQLGPRVTEARLSGDPKTYEMIQGTERSRLADLGIVLEGRSECTFFISAQGRTYGHCRVNNRGRNTAIVLGPPHRAGCVINVRVLRDNCAFVAVDLSRQSSKFTEVLMHEADQMFYFGARATAVSMFASISGTGCHVAIGDDCMLSSHVMIRNYDMHTIFDIESGAVINGPPVNVVVERHVWIGQDVMLLNATRVGYGSIVGAFSMLRGEAPACALLVGTPARVLRTGVGWSRTPGNIAPPDKQFYATQAPRLAAQDGTETA